MWCTRWYLPLILLPLPTAPPYFLILFLFSTTLHARPCFYCIILLSAMFMSSCYWPPVPIDTPLAVPWSDNITTFSEALHSLMPGLSEDMVPPSIPIVERCWCDFSTSGFFDPYNVTQWEINSVERLKEDLERRKVEEVSETEFVQPANSTTEGLSPDTEAAFATASSAVYPKAPSRKWASLWNILWPFSSGVHESEGMSYELPPNATMSDSPIFPDLAANDTQASRSLKPPRLRREYDLRKYGFAMVLDFGWSPTPVS